MSVTIANQKEAATYGHTVDCAVLEQHKFQRVIEDASVSFGDGGYVKLEYPVLVCPSLPVADDNPSRGKFLEELNAEMDRVATTRGDIQQNGVVEDIVDPELFPRLIPKHERRRAPPSKPCQTMRAALMNTDNRGSYTWIPTKVAYNTESGKSKLLGPIQNLPRTSANKRLYELLEQSLNEVMPSLYAQSARQVKKGKKKAAEGDDAPTGPVYAAKQCAEDPNVKLCNVTIKLQRYRMPPHSSYKGMWHTEGVTEGVASAAVLYVDWPKELEGGALKFRPVAVPDDCYREYMEKPWSGMASEADEESQDSSAEADEDADVDGEEDGSPLSEISCKSNGSEGTTADEENGTDNEKEPDSCEVTPCSVDDDDDSSDTSASDDASSGSSATVEENDEGNDEEDDEDGDESEDEGPHYKLTLSVPGASGSSVAFANTIPHRFKTLRNNTDKVLMRSFVNFFLTKPDLPDTNDVPTNADVYLALVGRTNYDVVGEVLQWLGNTPLSFEEAKALRSRSKAEMVDKRSKWGTIMYGNCGQLEFLATGGPTPTEMKRIEKLRERDEKKGTYKDGVELATKRAKKEGIDHSYTTWNWDEYQVAIHDDSTSDGKSLLTAGN